MLKQIKTKQEYYNCNTATSKSHSHKSYLLKIS